MSHQSSFKFIVVLTYCRWPIRHRARSISAITDKSKLGDQYGRKIKPFKLYSNGHEFYMIFDIN